MTARDTQPPSDAPDTERPPVDPDAPTLPLLPDAPGVPHIDDLDELEWPTPAACLCDDIDPSDRPCLVCEARA